VVARLSHLTLRKSPQMQIGESVHVSQVELPERPSHRAMGASPVTPDAAQLARSINRGAARVSKQINPGGPVVECLQSYPPLRHLPPGTWGARVTYHCPICIPYLPCPTFRGTLSPTWITIGSLPNPPYNDVEVRSRIGSAYVRAFRATRFSRHGSFDVCHMAFRTHLLTELHIEFQGYNIDVSPTRGGNPC
jgi:hypothetical protein